MEVGVQMDDGERRLVETEARSKSNTHRIDDLEENGKVLQKLATSEELLAQNMQVMAEERKCGASGWTRSKRNRRSAETA